MPASRAPSPVIVIFAAYELFQVHEMYVRFNNPYLLDLIPVFGGAAFLGLAQFLFSFKLRHILLPDEDDIRKKNEREAARAEKQAQANKKKQEKLYAEFEKNKSNYQESMEARSGEEQSDYGLASREEKEAILTAMKEERECKQSAEENVASTPITATTAAESSFQPSNIRLQFFEGPFTALYISIVAGIAIMILSFALMLNYVQVDSPEAYTSTFYLKLIAFTVLFWVGIALMLLGRSYIYFMETSCMAVLDNKLYCITLKQNFKGMSNKQLMLRAAGNVGKIASSVSVRMERAEAKNAAYNQFRSESFPGLAERLIKENKEVIPNEIAFDDPEANEAYNKAAYTYAMDMTQREVH